MRSRARGRYEKTDMQLCRHFHIAWQLRKFCSSLQGTGQGSAANPYERLFRFQSFLESWMNQHQPRLRRLNQVRRRQEDQSPLLGRQTIRHSPLPRAPRRRRLAWSASQSVSRAADISHFKSVRPPARPSVRPTVRPTTVHRSSDRWSMEGCRRWHRTLRTWRTPSLPPSPAVDTSHCPLPLKSPRIIQWGRTDERTDGEAGQPARRLAPTRERTNERTPHYIPFPLPFPSLPLRFPFAAAAAPSLRYRRTNENENVVVVGISKPQRRRRRLHREGEGEGERRSTL